MPSQISVGPHAVPHSFIITPPAPPEPTFLEFQKERWQHFVAHLGDVSLLTWQTFRSIIRRPLEWDAVNERFRNDDEANRLLSRPGRGPMIQPGLSGPEARVGDFSANAISAPA